MRARSHPAFLTSTDKELTVCVPLGPRQRRVGLGPLLSVTTRRMAGELVLLTAAGEIDLNTVPLLETELANALRSASLPMVVLDLGKVGFIGSAGLTALLNAHSTARALSGRLWICGATRPVSRPLEVTGLSELLDVCSTRTEALAHLRTSGVASP
jgi:anti-sigma B factor antagonist